MAKNGGWKKAGGALSAKMLQGRWHQLARAGIGDTFTRVPSASLLYEKTAKYCTVNVWNVMDGWFDRKPAKDDFKSLPPIDVGRLSPLFSGNLHTEL